jgi:hypothetical protein
VGGGQRDTKRLTRTSPPPPSLISIRIGAQGEKLEGKGTLKVVVVGE